RRSGWPTRRASGSARTPGPATTPSGSASSASWTPGRSSSTARRRPTRSCRSAGRSAPATGASCPRRARAPSGTPRRCGSADPSVPLGPLGDQRQHVVLGDRGPFLVGDVGVPADLAVVGALAGGDLLGGERDGQLVAGLDGGEEPQVLQAVVRQDRPGGGVDEQPRR